MYYKIRDALVNAVIVLVLCGFVFGCFWARYQYDKMIIRDAIMESQKGK